MIITLKNVLNTATLQQVQALLKDAQFVDGKLSAGDAASPVKNNQELSLQSPLHHQLNQLVMARLINHPVYQSAALPSKVATAYYSRYTCGMAYGAHVDDAVMGPLNGRYRSDISSTVFLNAPDDYDGGELRIFQSHGVEQFKLAAGDAVIYPSGYLHEVSEVTAGERLVAVSWAQSLVKSADQRQVLYDLSRLRNEASSPSETLKIDQIYSNLLRMWAAL